MAKRRPLDFAVLRARIAPIRVLGLLGWEYVTRIGDVFRGPCPVHVSKTNRSRSLSVTDRVWHCHACKAGGDAIRLWAVLRRTDDLTAAYELCERLGVEPPTL